MKIAEVKIPMMFTAYAKDLGYVKEHYYSDHIYQYSCSCCGQNFSAAWGNAANIGGYYEKGSRYHCPCCSYRHGDNAILMRDNEKVPLDVTLAVHEYKNHITLKMSGNLIYFTELHNNYTCFFREEFKFDIKTGKTIFSSVIGTEIKTIELGNPYDLDIFKTSILRFFKPFSVPLTHNIKIDNMGFNTRECVENQSKELKRLLKVLRETIQHKLEKKHKQKLTSLYCSHGSRHGLFLLPIFNIAFRIKFPYANNLSAFYRTNGVKDEYFFSMGSLEELEKRFEILPQTPTVKNILTKNPLDYLMLKEAFKICDNLDHGIAVYKWLSSMDRVSLENRSLEELLVFLKEVIKPKFGEPAVIKVITHYATFQVGDTIRQYNRLNDDNIKKFMLAKIRLRDIHDWVSIQYRLQSHKDIKFNIPEAIINRLSMQIDSLQFFMPEKSKDLVVAGTRLNNCVASYCDRMAEGKVDIVLVADDKGKLAACIEVRNKAIMQAKLKHNKPVKNDAALNKSIIEWAKSSELRIATSDIEESIMELTSKAC